MAIRLSTEDLEDKLDRLTRGSAEQRWVAKKSLEDVLWKKPGTDEDVSQQEKESRVQDFCKRNLHKKMVEYLLSDDMEAVEFTLSLLDNAMCHTYDNTLVIYFGKHKECINRFADLLGKLGERPRVADPSVKLQTLMLDAAKELAREYECRKPLLDKFMPVLKTKYLAVEKHENKMQAFLVAANLIGASDESEDLELLKCNESTVHDLIYALSTGWTKDKTYSFGVKEIVPPLLKLAMNKKNAELLVEHGIVEALMATMRSDRMKTEQDVDNCLQFVINLTCDENLAAKFEKSGAMDCVMKLKEEFEGSSEIKRRVEQVVWILKKKYNAPAESGAAHIMISYSWAQQDLVLKLRKLLEKHNLPVWIDTEQMRGDTLETMAKAVENSMLVLICYSGNYKESTNCRLEGEYVVQRKKPFIPVLVEAGFKPDGWLGLIIGTRLYYDICMKYETIAQQLLEAIKKDYSGIVNERGHDAIRESPEVRHTGRQSSKTSHSNTSSACLIL